MRVNGLDHFNVITTDLDGTARFYAELLGLQRRDGPPPLTSASAQWMYDDAGRAIVHINTADAPQAFLRQTPAGPQTGALHHIALGCTGYAEMLARLAARGLDHYLNEISAIGLRQIFVSDPNGVLLELNFFGD